MKKFSQLVTLLPCQSLEDFPVYGSKADARSLLAAWTGLWHPTLIANSGVAPTWRRADDTVSSEEEAAQHRDSFIHQHYYDDDDTANWDDQLDEFDQAAFNERWKDCLVVVPTPSAAAIYDGFIEAARNVGAHVVTEFESRSQLIADLELGNVPEANWIADFFSLGYMRLQIEMMTRKLRFSSDLDVERFDSIVVAAANSVASSSFDDAKTQLQSAFDLLAEEKNRYYPVAADLIDMVLLADSIRPESIAAEVEASRPISFYVSGDTLRKIAEKSANTVEAIRSRLDDGTASVIGGPENELPDNLLSVETMLNQLLVGRKTSEQFLGQTPEVFMRRKFGLNVALPGVLESLQFSGALHVTLDRGEIPGSSSNSIRWVGADGGAVMALTELPLDSASDKSFLDLGVKIGSELDSAHISTVFFARWPTQTCDSLEDIRNSLKYGNLLGDFSDADTYFQNVYDPGYGDSFDAEEYKSPWLSQAISSESRRPISTFVDYWRCWYQLAAARSMVAMLVLSDSGRDVSEIASQISELQNRLEMMTSDWSSDWDEAIESGTKKLNRDLLSQLGCSFVNTVAWRRLAHLSFDSTANPNGSVNDLGPLKHAALQDGRCDVVNEMSGFGRQFTDLEPEMLDGKNRKQPLIDDGVSKLRNEFFEVRMDEESGGIKGVHFYGARGNLLSQKLAVRYVDESSGAATYSKMVCDSFEVITLSQIASEARSRGRLVDEDGNQLAQFAQVVGLQRGRSIIDVSVELTEVKPLGNSESNYLANRIAWSDDTAELYCDMQGMRQPVRSPKLEAPHFVEVVQSDHRFAVLTHGLPWHRRASKKILDTMLLAGNESRTRFQFAIAVDQTSLMQLAVAEMHPLIFDERSVDKSRESDWLLHLSNRNLIVTWSEPVFVDGECVGLRFRLQETDGKKGKLKLYCKRNVEIAELETFENESKHPADVSRTESGTTVVETSFAANEYFQLSLRWIQKD